MAVQSISLLNDCHANPGGHEPVQVLSSDMKIFLQAGNSAASSAGRVECSVCAHCGCLYAVAAEENDDYAP